MYKYCPIYVKGALPVMEEGDLFKLTVRYEKESGIENTQKSNIKHADKIPESIKENPTITIPEMAKFLSVTTRTVERTVSKLIDEKAITREGSKKDGKWIIVAFY